MQLMHTRWPIFAALVVGCLATAAMWYAVLANPSGEAVPAAGGRFVEGVTRPPERINPLFASASPTDADLVSLIFSGLVRLGPDGTPQPDLAERWEITGNGTSYVFHLRSGIAWHDGPNNAFDADDVVFTYRAITDPAFRGDRALAQLMDGVVVSARDPQTVEFKLQQPYAPFLTYLTLGILPRHLLSDLDADGLFNATFNAAPVGTGPYRFRGIGKDRVVLESNPTYHLGPPHISALELRFYEDGSELVQALRKSDIDGALLRPDAPAADVRILESDRRFQLQLLAGTSFGIVYLNPSLPLFSDPVVRGALARAVNPQLIAVEQAEGRGVPALAGIPIGSWAYSDVEGKTFDPGAAARDLEVAGWTRGRDGIRVKEGQRLAFTLSTSNDPKRAAIAEQLARQMRAIGASVTVEPLDASTYTDDTLFARTFEAAVAEIDYGADPDPYPFWHSSQVATPGRNLAGYRDATVDDVLERARQTTDDERRKDLYRLFAGYLVAAAPAIPLYHPVSVYVMADDVHGFEGSLLITPASRFANVNGWYIRTRVR